MGNDILQVQGINSKGYGIIPKLVMQDKRLTTEAKAIYGYFCSYAGAGRTAFPSRDKIVSDLGMSKSRFYVHFNQLKDYGYIKVEQEHKGGRYTRNIYTLNEFVQCPDFKDTVQKNTLQCPKKQYTKKQDTEIQCPINEDNNNNSFKNNNLNMNNPVKSSLSVKQDGQDKTEEIDLKIKAYTELIKDNIQYNDLAIAKKFDLGLIDEFIAIILDVLMSEGQYIRINSENKPRELVKHNLLRLTYYDIEHAIDQFKGVTERITKKKQYIITMLYNCKMEMDSHYTNLVKSDKWQ